MSDLLEAMVGKLLPMSLNECGVIPWGSPIPGFGRVEEARVATLGINPSNLEFVDQAGRELTGPQRRFHTLRSLELDSWASITTEHVKAVAAYCRSYFERNPYDGWFRPLDELLNGAHASYYSSLVVSHAACHLDLVPFATVTKWGLLARPQQQQLLRSGVETLGQMLGGMRVDILILNGAAVVRQLQDVADLDLHPEPKPDWDLPRKTGTPVRGIAYRGTLSGLPGIRLRKGILVLGYNHNLQSSYGITRAVKDALREWIRAQSAGVES